MSDHSSRKTSVGGVFAAVATVLALATACGPDQSLASHKQAASTPAASSSVVKGSQHKSAANAKSESKAGSATSVSPAAQHPRTVTPAAHTPSNPKAAKPATPAKRTPKAKAMQHKAPTTVPTVHNLMIPKSGVYLGVSSSTSTASGNARIVSRIGRQLDLDENFVSFTTADGPSNINTSILRAEQKLTTMSIITWQPQLHGSNEDIMPAIAAGKYDPYLTHVAVQLRSFRDPVMIRFAHEMNGNWYPWSGCQNGCTKSGAVQYVLAWRHVWNLFQRVHARNVIWAWIPASADIGTTMTTVVNGQTTVVRRHWTDYFPGKKYVDWGGYDSYLHPQAPKGTGPNNTVTVRDVYASWIGGERRGIVDNQLTSKETINSDYNLVNGTLARLPLIIAETMNGPVLDENVDKLVAAGQIDPADYDKRHYFSTAVASLKKLPGIKAVVFFDHNTASDTGNAHDYCVDEQACHGKVHGATMLAPNADSNHRNFMAFYKMARDCYLDPHKRQGKCHN